MTPIDLIKLAGLLVFIVGLLAIAVRIFWWAADMDSICNLFDESK